MRRRLDCVVIAVIFIALLQACASTPTQENAPPASFAKYPLHAGVYYSREFAEARYGQGIEALGVTSVPVGAAGVNVFNDGLAQLFDKVTRLDSLSSDELREKRIDVVVVPTLEHLALPIGFTGHRPNEHAVAYRTTLRTTAGIPFASWIVFGTVSHWATVATPRGLIDAYIEKAGANYVGAFHREGRPALQATAGKRGIDSRPEELTRVSITASEEDVPGVNAADAALLKRLGVVTIRVVAKSPVGRPLEVRASDMRLEVPDDLPMDPAPVSAVAHLYTVAVPSPGSIGLTPAGAAIGAVLAAGAAQGRRYEAFKQSPATSAFGSRKLEGDREESGVVWFLLGGSGLPEGATLTAWILDPAEPGTGTLVRVPVMTR